MFTNGTPSPQINGHYGLYCKTHSTFLYQTSTNLILWRLRLLISRLHVFLKGGSQRKPQTQMESTFPTFSYVSSHLQIHATSFYWFNTSILDVWQGTEDETSRTEERAICVLDEKSRERDWQHKLEHKEYADSKQTNHLRQVTKSF